MGANGAIGVGTMKFKAYLENNIVTSVFVVAKPDEYKTPSGKIEVDAEENWVVGGSYVGGVYAAPQVDPSQRPLTPPQFHAMVKYIKAQTGQDMDALIRAGIVAAAGGDAESLPALASLETYGRSQQYRFDHPLSVGVAAAMIANGVMTEQQRSDWWLQAANL